MKMLFAQQREEIYVFLKVFFSAVKCSAPAFNHDFEVHREKMFCSVKSFPLDAEWKLRGYFCAAAALYIFK
jgi:hypothetical protein